MTSYVASTQEGWCKPFDTPSMVQIKLRKVLGQRGTLLLGPSHQSSVSPGLHRLVSLQLYCSSASPRFHRMSFPLELAVRQNHEDPEGTIANLTWSMGQATIYLIRVSMTMSTCPILNATPHKTTNTKASITHRRLRRRLRIVSCVTPVACLQSFPCGSKQPKVGPMDGLYASKQAFFLYWSSTVS